MNHMLSTAILIALSTVAIAADAPKELTSLKDSYLKARSQALAPIERKYLEALIAMKTKFTKAGDLDSALSVDMEIKALQPPTDNLPTTISPDAQPLAQNAKQKRMTKELVDSSWDCETWKASMTFNGDGTVTFSGGSGSMSKWQVTSEGKLELSQGREFRECELARDDKSFQVNFGGKLNWRRKK